MNCSTLLKFIKLSALFVMAWALVACDVPPDTFDILPEVPTEDRDAQEAEPSEEDRALADQIRDINSVVCALAVNFDQLVLDLPPGDWHRWFVAHTSIVDASGAREVLFNIQDSPAQTLRYRVNDSTDSLEWSFILRTFSDSIQQRIRALDTVRTLEMVLTNGDSQRLLRVSRVSWALEHPQGPQCPPALIGEGVAQQPIGPIDDDLIRNLPNFDF